MQQPLFCVTNRKRYEVTCDGGLRHPQPHVAESFNTASGMRSHVTEERNDLEGDRVWFQYRKRYEITCDPRGITLRLFPILFQYRKRYEITCDVCIGDEEYTLIVFQYRKRYEITCDD